jgi:fucose 4-O-acetylase-like acetyltransferase
MNPTAISRTVDLRPDGGNWILIAKGIGILLVVAGHFYPDGSPFYWSEARAVIYSFHMPLFFAISGYLYVTGKFSYGTLITNKIKRLLYPFITVAIIYLLIKYAVGLAAHLDHPVDIRTVYNLIVDPLNSFVPLLWFVHALFIIFLVYPLARRFLGAITIFVMLLIINAVFGSKFLVIGKALANMPFFALGVILRERPRIFAILVDTDNQHLTLSTLIFAAGCLIALPGTNGFPAAYATQVFLAVAGSLFVINLSVAISIRGNDRVRLTLSTLGYYSMTIYLFHTLFESTVRFVFQGISRRTQVAFPLIALTAIALGLVVPVFLEKRFLRKWTITRKFVLGIT